MFGYFLRRLRDLLLTLFLTVSFVFLMFRVIPGDPARIAAGVEAGPEKVALLAEQMGTNQPVGRQYINYLAGFFTGNPGRSLRFQRPVAELIGEALPVTLSLAFCAVLIIVILALPLSVLAANKPGRFLDRSLQVGGEVCLAIPPFFMAIILMLLFRLTPTALSERAGWLRLLLPALAVALSRLAMAVEFLRDALVFQREQDYVRTARGKGLKDGAIMWKHVLRNSLLPAITALGLIVAEVVGGSIIIEQVFMLPGLGRLLITAVEARDFPLASGIIIFIAVAIILINFAVDLINRKIDPRLVDFSRPFRVRSGHRQRFDEEEPAPQQKGHLS